MNILPGSATLRAAAVPANQAVQGPRPAADVAAQAQPQAAAKSAEVPRQDKVATAYRFERPLPPPRPNAPRGSTVNLLV